MKTMREMTLKDLQNVSLEILKDVHQFCVKHNIKYTLQGGTLIGAIRHKGFIPWDDDLDIAMPRPDYERFIHSYKSENGYKLFARGLSDCGEVYIAYARVCEMRRTYVDDSAFPFSTIKKGVWIDIFPLDGIEEDTTEQKRRMRRLKFFWHIGTLKRGAHTNIDNITTWEKKLKCIILKVLSPFLSYKAIDKHISICKEIPWDSAASYGNLAFLGYGLRDCHHKRVLEETILTTFEDAQFYIMKGYDEALREKFGDYMKLPPEEQRVGGHSQNKFYWT